MRKNINRNQNTKHAGFTGVAIIMVLVVAGLLGVAGWLVYSKSHGSNATSTGYTATSSAASDTGTSTATPAAGSHASWPTFKLKYEGASFTYPPTFKLSDQTDSTPNDEGDKSDMVRLDGPNNFIVYIKAGGNGHPSGDGPTPVLAATPLTFLGKPGFVDYTSDLDDNLVEAAYVSQSETSPLDTFKSRADGGNVSGSGGNFLIRALYSGPGGLGIRPGLTAGQAKQDANYQVFEQIVKSFSY